MHGAENIVDNQTQVRSKNWERYTEDMDRHTMENNKPKKEVDGLKQELIEEGKKLIKMSTGCHRLALERRVTVQLQEIEDGVGMVHHTAIIKNNQQKIKPSVGEGETLKFNIMKQAKGI